MAELEPVSPRTKRRRKRDRVSLAGHWVKVQCLEVISILWIILIDVVSLFYDALPCSYCIKGTP